MIGDDVGFNSSWRRPTVTSMRAPRCLSLWHQIYHSFFCKHEDFLTCRLSHLVEFDDIFFLFVDEKGVLRIDLICQSKQITRDWQWETLRSSLSPTYRGYQRATGHVFITTIICLVSSSSAIVCSALFFFFFLLHELLTVPQTAFL